MERSRCCDAPVVVEVLSDVPNFTDDAYDLKVPMRVCSQCGAVLRQDVTQGGKAKHATAEGNDKQSKS